MKSTLSRRAWLTTIGAGMAIGRSRTTGASQAGRPGAPVAAAQRDSLLLKDFEPRSMLVVPETPIARARFPVVDVHSHPTFRATIVAGGPQGEAMRARVTPADLIALMERRNLRTIVDLTGGVGAGLAETVRTFQQ